jgi:pimeloyl-ACP methyl ester carboxylesterase
MGRGAAILLAGLIALPAAAQDLPGPRGGGWTALELDAGGRRLTASVPPTPRSGEVLTVILEGDGAAHDRRGAASEDPTPRRPTGFAIARAWAGLPPGPGADGPTAWLGRLCQYGARRDPDCTVSDWTDGRFSEHAVAAADAAVSLLKTRTGAERVRLIGWSGGGVVAALVAARRDDVVALVTLASPLDLAGWTRSRGLSPLARSLDPAALAPTPGLAQVHLFGRFDPVVPAAAMTPAARRLGGPRAVVEVWDQKHACCWARAIPAIAEATQGSGGGAGRPGNPSDQPTPAP